MSENKKGRYVSAGIILVVLIVFFLHMQGYLGPRVEPGRSELTQQQLDNLETAVVKGKDLEEFESVMGTVSSRKDTIISAKIPAHVKKILVHPGEKVSAGDLLIVLDDRDIKAKMGQAQSGLAAARAAKAQAESAYNRFQKLLKTGATTQAQFEQVEAQYQMASAKVKEAEKAIEELKVMLGYTEIRAPYSGVVVEKLTNEGALAAPGVPLLRLEDPEQLRLEVYVPESLRNTISAGKTLMVRIDTLNKEIPGKVDEIVPSADPRSRSFMVRIALEQQEGLRSGMFGRCYLPIENRKAILVDKRAVYRVGQLEMVQVLEENRLRTRLVRVGKEYGDDYEILSGLQPGETVVLKNS